MGFGHWNQNGHRCAGELIARRLCELLEPPAPAPSPPAGASQGPPSAR
jgi:hypothetical protein